MYRYLLFVLLLFSACKHTQDCPGFNMADAGWLVYNVNDTIKFTNAANDKITFVVAAKAADPSYTENCQRGQPTGYYCEACTTRAYVYALSDTTRGGYNRLGIMLYNSESEEKLTFGIFDNSANLMFDFDTHQADPYGMLDSISLGGSIYHDVYFHESDTTNAAPYFGNAVVWKIYYNKQYGILGFNDGQSHSLYYRE